MAIYTWEGRTQNGKALKGQMEAEGVQQVFDALKKQKITPNTQKIKEQGTGFDKEIKIPGFGPKAKTKDVVIFTRQFSTMIDAGLPLIQGLNILASGSENPAMKKVLIDVKEYVESGGTLAEGLGRHPDVFDQLFVNMVAAGEAGGILDIILERLAAYLEKMDNLKKQVKTAMIYPAVVVGAAIIVSTILLVFVIPTFGEMFADFGAALPVPTQIVINMSDFIISKGHLIVLGTFGSFYFTKKFLKTERGKDVAHPIYLKFPVFGSIIKKVAVSRFTRTMSTMLNSGVPIIDALTICAKTSGNKVVEREVNSIRQSISEGKTLVEPLLNSNIFPPMVVQMINVGEATGALDAMLGKIADFYDTEVENAVNGMKQLIEPLMILFLGTVVGGLVVAMYLPIFKLGSVMN